jgi:fibronectin type 3 domain-containing protein
MSNDPKEWFRILDLNPGASLDEVKRSYRELAKVWHPDRFAHDSSLLRKAHEKMKQLNHAYQQLCTVHVHLADPEPGRYANREQRTSAGSSPGKLRPAPPMASMSGGGDAYVRLTWSPVYGASSYNVKRSIVSGGPYAIVAHGVAWTDYVDHSVANGTRYYYVVSAVDGSLESADSPELTAQPLATPAAPTHLTAVLTAGKGVQLGWNQSTSPDIRWNIVYRSTNGTAYVQIAQVNAGTSYLDLQANPEATYRYTATAVNSNAQQSQHSNAAAVRTE